MIASRAWLGLSPGSNMPVRWHRSTSGLLPTLWHFITWFLLITLTTISLVTGQQLQPPRIKEHPVSLTVKKHEPAKLECKADGNPLPIIEWYKDNEKVQASAHRLLLADSLFFLHVVSKKGDGGDTGTYYCVARNEVGKAKSRNATLEVAVLREEFRMMPSNVQVAMGETAELQCTPPRGRPEPVVWWAHNGNAVPTDTGRFKLDGHNLVISDVTKENEGRYYCIAKNMAGIRESPPAILKVLVKPYFIRPPEDIKAMSEDDVIFPCKVGGDPPPEITWKKLEGKIPIGKSQILEDKALKIHRVRPSDEGTYVCEVENQAGKITNSATLTVNSYPSFVAKPQNMQVPKGSTIHFDCLVTGNPQPLFFWSKEGTQMLMFPGKSYGKFNVSNDGTLSIASVDKEDHGFYICSAVSSVGSAITRAFLTVLTQDHVPPPIIRLGASNQTLPLNTKAFLPCEVTGSPKPSIKWFFNQTPIHNNTHYTITNNMLEIQNIQRDDSGLYTCVASNLSGSSEWRAELLVESPHNPNIRFNKMHHSSTFPEAPTKPVIVNQTESTITVKWQKVGSSASHIGSILEYYSPDLRSGWVVVARRIQHNIFTVRDLKPNTRYMFLVRMENKQGIGYPSDISDETRTLDYGNSHSMEEDDSSQPRALLSDASIKLKEVRTISSTSIKLFWLATGNIDFIEGFYIRYQSMHNEALWDSHFNMVTVFGGNTNSYTLNNLRKFSRYHFFLVPFYRSIEGRPSNMLSGKTFEDVPSSPPRLIVAKTVNTSCAVIEWASPLEENQNGIILGYHLQVYENNSILYTNLTLDARTTSVVFYNLTLGSLYAVRMLAFTATGNGPMSHPVYWSMDSDLTEDQHTLQPTSHQFLSSFFWFYLFVAIVIVIFFIIVVRIILIYTSKKSNKPIYEKANSMNENLSDNFPKYDSTSSKYSSCPDNNEYAEVSDLKNYGDCVDPSEKSPMPYAMTPLIEKSHEYSSRHGGKSGNNAVFHQLNDDRFERALTESLLSEHHTAKYDSYASNKNGDASHLGMSRLARHAKRSSPFDQSLLMSNNFDMFHSDYENTDDRENSKEYERKSTNSGASNQGSIGYLPSSSGELNPQNSMLLDGRKYLLTFHQGKPNGMQSHIISNPLSSFDTSSESSSSHNHFSTHYHVSSEIGRMQFGERSETASHPFSSFPLAMRHSDFNSPIVLASQRRNDSHIHTQVVSKNKAYKKRKGTQSVNSSFH